MVFDSVSNYVFLHNIKQTRLISIVSIFVVENVVQKVWSKNLVKNNNLFFFRIGSKNKIWVKKYFWSKKIFGQKNF